MTGTPQPTSVDEITHRANKLIAELDHEIQVARGNWQALDEIANGAQQTARHFAQVAVRAAAAALARTNTPDLCLGSGQFVRGDDTDGDGVGTCPGCCKYKATDPVNSTWRAIRTHLVPVAQRSGSAA